MNIKQVNPYIHLNGSAAQAIAFYESAIGAKPEGVMKYGDVPGMNTPEESKNCIMHAMLHVGPGVIMISDSPGKTYPSSESVQIVLDFTEVADITKAFAALSEGGKVVQPLEDTFWGAKFGMLIDQFGIHWMLNCELKKA